MTDQELVIITKEVDELLAALCVKHNISPLSLGAVINARLIWACRETNAEGDFFNLLQIISAGPPEDVKQNHIHH